MEASLAVLALKALDGLSLRSLVTAQNIANGNTAGYRPLRVDFEDALKAAAARGPEAVAALQPSIERASFRPAESEMRLDLELATASTTSARYAALIEVLNREMKMTSLAIRGDR
jgi:flagellar basal-body rod protein FlgB